MTFTPVDTNMTGNEAHALHAPVVSRTSFSMDNHSDQSAVSWAAIFAGATAAAALSLVLLVLGTGLGLSAVSPWTPQGISAEALGVYAIVWMTVVQLLASGMGGYIAGRLRTKWASVHSDEVYFRDTAHGFLAWALASLVTAALLSSVTGSIISKGVQAGASVVDTATTGMSAMAASSGAGGRATLVAGGASADMPLTDSGSYFIDALFRKDLAAPEASAVGNAVPLITMPPSTNSAVVETGRIFLTGIRSGALPADDIRYVGQLVSQRTGLSQPDAEKRVADTFARLQTKLRGAELAARDAADKARKASSYTALWLFISLLTGAFVASLAATFGGRQRDFQVSFQST